MPRVVITCETPAGRQFTLTGFMAAPFVEGTSEISIEESTAFIEANLPITGLTDAPEPGPLTAVINGLPAQVATSSSTPLTATLLNEAGGEVEPYVLANWTWTVVSGDASFTGDTLNAGTVAGPIVVQALHIASNTSVQAATELVAAVQNTAEFYNLPAQVEEGQDYPLEARLLDSEGAIIEQYDPANWTWSITSGPATITGPNADVLSVDPASAPATVVVRGTHDATSLFDENSASVVAVGEPFPENLPGGFDAPFLVSDGSSKDFGPGWEADANWNDPVRVEVIADAASKFGSVIEQRFFAGDDSGYPAGRLRLPPSEIALQYREVYVRVVMLLSNNWQQHPGGDQYVRGVGVGVQGFKEPVPSVVFGQYVFADGGVTPTFPHWFPIIPGSPDKSTVNVNDLVVSNDVPEFTRGVYHTLEVIRRTASGSAPTSRDGYIRFWFDGIEFTRWTAYGAGPRSNELQDVPLSAIHGIDDPTTFPGSSQILVPMRWGGTGALKDVNDSVRYSEIVVAGRDQV